MSQAAAVSPVQLPQVPRGQDVEFSATLRHRLLQTQVASLYGHMAVASVISTVFALVLVVYLSPTFGAEVAQTWFVCKAGFAAIRFHPGDASSS